MNKPIVKITDQLEMAGFIKSNGTQCRFVSLVCNTKVTNIRAGCPYKGVRKIARKVGLVNVNYNNSVRTRVANILGVDVKAVEYENGEVWYEHVLTPEGKTLPLVVHKKDHSKMYLQFYPQSSQDKYVMPDTGLEVAKSDLEPWFYARGDKPVFKPAVIAIALENVHELRASGVVLQSEDFDAELAEFSKA